MLGEKLHRYLYLLGMITLLAGLPFSPFLTSLGQFILVGNWLIELNFREKLRLINKRPGILLFTSLFLVHVVWFIHTSNFQYAQHDIVIKLPLLALPVIIGTSRPLNQRETILILQLFAASIFAASVYSAALFFGVGSQEVIDKRQSSVFISHIRFALMIVLTCYILMSLLAAKEQNKILVRVIYLISLTWFVFYLLFIGAFSGVVILSLSFPFVLAYWLRKTASKKVTLYSWLLLSLLVLISIAYLGYSIKRYYTITDTDSKSLPTHTINGNPYKHNLNLKIYENGHLVWVSINDKELGEQWELRSDFKFWGKDLKGQDIRTTLIRYLTSMGYTKDSVGISQLTQEDINFIEAGTTNYLMKNKWAIYPRIYELLWEIEQYKIHGDPSGHSLSQRLEFMSNGLRVFGQHAWWGVGTGDVNDEIMKQYEMDNSILQEKWRFRPHNQYITFLVAFGSVGMLLIIGLFAAGLVYQKHNIDQVSLAFLLIVLLSMLSEDTLETQAGATFYAFFLSLLFLGRNLNSVNNESIAA